MRSFDDRCIVIDFRISEILGIYGIFTKEVSICVFSKGMIIEWEGMSRVKRAS
jgi:hypothetical protein